MLKRSIPYTCNVFSNSYFSTIIIFWNSTNSKRTTKHIIITRTSRYTRSIAGYSIRTIISISVSCCTISCSVTPILIPNHFASDFKPCNFCKSYVYFSQSTRSLICRTNRYIAIFNRNFIVGYCNRRTPLLEYKPRMICWCVRQFKRCVCI